MRNVKVKGVNWKQKYFLPRTLQGTFPNFLYLPCPWLALPSTLFSLNSYQKCVAGHPCYLLISQTTQFLVMSQVLLTLLDQSSPWNHAFLECFDTQLPFLGPGQGLRTIQGSLLMSTT